MRGVFRVQDLGKFRVYDIGTVDYRACEGVKLKHM